MDTKRIGFLVYDGIQALDVVGPLEAFMAATTGEAVGSARRCYETVIVGLNGKTCVSETGIILKPHTSIKSMPRLDTLIVPGGKGLREPEFAARVGGWINSVAPGIRRIGSVCTGLYGLAASGLLDGRKVTTHWAFAKDAAQRFPKLKVNANALFLKDGRFYTSAGITAGIDLALALIEEDYGRTVALAVARELVVYLKRSGGQEQYSEPLKFQTESTDHLAELGTWIKGHLDHDLSVEALAAKAYLCPRHFSRRFKEVFGNTPAGFVEDLRLAEAKDRLSMRTQTIETVAVSVGYKSADAFSRAFERRFGVKPSSQRKHFAPHPAV